MYLAEMIEGRDYLVGDSMGYDLVTCLGSPSEEEIKEAFGCTSAGTFMKVRMIEENYESILYELNPGFLYIEPR